MPQSVNEQRLAFDLQQASRLETPILEQGAAVVRNPLHDGASTLSLLNTLISLLVLLIRLVMRFGFPSLRDRRAPFGSGVRRTIGNPRPAGTMWEATGVLISN